MTRIIAGVARGRRLTVPAGTSTRPTSDRTREGLFSSLISLRGSLDGAGFLDLYAGSGAVGLEAASRGCATVVLVERDPAAVRALRTNVDRLSLPGVEVRAQPVERVVGEDPPRAYDVVFVDPPYNHSVDELLERLVAHDWVAEGGVVCVERSSRRAHVAWPAGITSLQSRRYGEATLCYGRRP